MAGLKCTRMTPPLKIAKIKPIFNIGLISAIHRLTRTVLSSYIQHWTDIGMIAGILLLCHQSCKVYLLNVPRSFQSVQLVISAEIVHPDAVTIV